MSFKIDKNSCFLFENSEKMELGKRKFRNSDVSRYIENINFTTLDNFINNEVTVFWSLLEENSIRPEKISRNASLCVLFKIIGERRMFDGYFSSVRSTEFFLAAKIYNIMMKAAYSLIPVAEISMRIERFKRGLRKGDTYIDLKNVIAEYRTVMERFGLVDNPMVLECFEKLLKNNMYISHLSKKEFFAVNYLSENRKIYKKIREIECVKERLDKGEIVKLKGISEFIEDLDFRDSNIISSVVRDYEKGKELNTIEVCDDDSFDAFIIEDMLFRKIDLCSEKGELYELFSEDVMKEKKYESVNLYNVRQNMKISDLKGFNYSGRYKVMDFDNYFEMLFSLESLIADLTKKGVNYEDIALIMPRADISISNFIDKLKNQYNIPIEKIGDISKIFVSDLAIASLSAYSILKNCGDINIDNKVELVKFILEGIVRNREQKNLVSASLIDDDIYSDYEDRMYFTEGMEEEYINEEYFSYELAEAFDKEVEAYDKCEKIEHKENEYEKKYGIDLYKISEDDINYIYIRKNINKLIEVILKDDRILPTLPEKDEEASRFFKKFYRLYGDINEKGIKEISQLSDLFKEISVFSDKEEKYGFAIHDEKKIECIINHLSTSSPVRIRIEKYNLKNIAACTYREYISSGMDRKVKIIFDALSPSYDEKVENEINTNVAYFEDDILSEIPIDSSGIGIFSEILGKIGRKIEIAEIKRNISYLMGKEKEDEKVYIMNSYTSMGGYDQENRFMDILVSALEGR